MRDVILRNPTFLAPKLQKIITFFGIGIGSPISTKNMAYTLTSSGNKTTISEVEEYGHILENIVFLELRRRGFQTLAGSISGFEIDFVAQKKGESVFIQVSADVSDEATVLLY